MLFKKSIMKRENKEMRHRNEFESDISKELTPLLNDPQLSEEYKAALRRTKTLVNINNNISMFDCNEAYEQGENNGILKGYVTAIAGATIGLIIGSVVVNSMSNHDEEVESE